MKDENKLNLYLDYEHHLVMLMNLYSTNVHRLDHLMEDNYIQSIQSLIFTFHSIHLFT